MFPGFVRYDQMISKASLSIFLFLFSLLVHAEESSDVDSAEAKAKDAEESQAIIEQVKAASETGSTKETREWIPSAEKYDWIQLTSNEWLKGEIKGMYKDSLEFDSDKLDLLEIDWDDGNGFQAAGVATGLAQQETLAVPYATNGLKTIQMRTTDAPAVRLTPHPRKRVKGGGLGGQRRLVQQL